MTRFFFTVPSRRIGQSGLRCTPADAVALSVLWALAAYTDDYFVDKSGRHWFHVRLREVAELLLLTTNSGAHHRLRRMEKRGLINLRRVSRKVYVAFRPEVERIFRIAGGRNGAGKDDKALSVGV